MPVLEHTQNETTLSRLQSLLQHGKLKQQYGGMIFTSQRAVEAWASIVSTANTQTFRLVEQDKDDPFSDIDRLTSFPLYVVGPATAKALTSLVQESLNVRTSAFIQLNPSIHGAESGNGANLAQIILRHYNQCYAEHLFTYFEAPRLPFIPLLGMSSQNYGRKRLEKDDTRLQKKPLLFLVGETRRDVIPKTLHGAVERIEVDEVEVYATQVMKSFEKDMGELCQGLIDDGSYGPRVVVVFSPQGCDIMLRQIGYLDQDGKLTDVALNRWWQQAGGTQLSKWIIVTIGPSTKEYLKDKFDVESDVCAEKPNPESLRAGIEQFLERHNIR